LLMGMAALFRPRTRGWAKAHAAIADYVAEQNTRQHDALALGASGANSARPACRPLAAEANARREEHAHAE
jgi:hypothetical protein